MTIGLTPEQQQLAEAVTQFAARHAPIEKTRRTFEAIAAGEVSQWWDGFVVHGFHAVHLPEAMGGQGGTLMDTACVVEAAATALLPGPVVPTVTAGAIALLADDTPVRGRCWAASPRGRRRPLSSRMPSSSRATMSAPAAFTRRRSATAGR